MKLTKTKLKQLIKEELEDHNLLNEQDIPQVNEKSWVNRDGTPNIAAMKKGLADGGYKKGADGGLKKWLRNRKGQGYLKAFRAYYTAHRKQKAAKSAAAKQLKDPTVAAIDRPAVKDDTGGPGTHGEDPLSRLEQDLINDSIAIEALAKKKEYANVRQDLFSLNQDIANLRSKMGKIIATVSMSAKQTVPRKPADPGAVSQPSGNL